MGIDSRLKWVLEERATPQRAFHDALELLDDNPNEAAWQGPRTVDVLVRASRFANRATFEYELSQVGFEVHSVGGGPALLTATGRLDIDRLAELDACSSVARVEAPRELQPELGASLPHCRADLAHAMVPSADASRALVGVIDSGIDYAHPVFQRQGTRILALWDQAAPPVAGGSVPYGRVYTSADINAALGGAAIPHQDTDGHGTHVASIAAGSMPRDGVATSAGLIIVSLDGNGQTLGRSKNALDAFQWVVDQAKARGLPVAINLSQGMNGGSHAGTSLLEVAMDVHCREPGVALIKSAGNEQQWRIHASTVLALGAVSTLEVVCGASKRSPGQLELWFDAEDDVEVSVQPPTGAGTPWVNLANVPQNFTLAGGNLVRIDAELDPEGTDDHLINVFFAPGGSAIGIVPGTWRVSLRAAAIRASGAVHAWLERTGRRPPTEQLRFSPSSSDPTCTISIPGTARRVVTVGSCVTTPSPPGSSLVGSLSTFSSYGPTRFGIQKPDLVAPGEFIEAARSVHSSANGAWVAKAGTSMAAPHVTGAAAILLSEQPTLTGDQVRQILTRTARATASSPDSQVGAGFLDVEAATALLRSGTITFPVVLSANVQGTSFVLQTQSASTASLLYDTSPGKLSAGRRRGALASLNPANIHTFDLQFAGYGTWYFEVVVFDAGWRTLADDAGAPWRITVP